MPIVLQTSLGSCGLLSGAFSWQLSAKSPSETQRKRERKRKKGPSSGPYNLETGSSTEAPTSPTVFSGNKPVGANAEFIFPKETQSCVPGRPAIVGEAREASVCKRPQEHH